VFHPPRGVECSDQLEQARGGRVEVGGQLGDLIAELVELRGGMRKGEHSGRVDLHRSLLVLRRLYTPVFGSRGGSGTSDFQTRNGF